MRWLKCFLFLVLSLCGNSYAWWSIDDPSTHGRISTWAISLLDSTEFPDIHRFSGTIIGATSGKTNDDIAHGKEDRGDAGKFNGGDFGKWWKFATDGYKVASFTGDKNAYFRIGSMAHLVQDQAVPAHAANIFHPLPYTLPDDLENY
mgnify:CR=1 FL=1